jgi:hypothetical protein
MPRDSFLTSKQLEVLKLRTHGHTQEEIAKIMGTSRVNVSITERRARENIEKARQTLRTFEKLDPIVLEVPEGTDIFEVPSLVYREADKHGIKVLYNTTSLIGILRRKKENKIMGNRVTKRFKVLILRGGRVEFGVTSTTNS